MRQVGATLHRGAGAALHRGARASHYRGPSRCGAQAPDAQAQQLWLTGPVAPWHVGSSQTRARTRVPCIGRQIPSHCATREAPLFFLMSLSRSLSILFIFSKNELLVLLIFAIVFFVSISFTSALIFMISFLLLTLGFVCSSFSSSFR